MSISIFPAIHPEESLSFYVERICELHPRLHHRNIVAKAFLHPWRDPSALLPRYLDQFAREVGANIGSSNPQFWLWSHTYFPMSSAFLPRELAAELERRVISGGPGPASQAGERDLCRVRFVKVCPACARDDIAQHGYCWVRRAHLSPYSAFCLEHEVALVEVSDYRPGAIVLNARTSKRYDRQLEIEEITQSFLQRANTSQGFADLNTWVKSHLAYRGYLTRAGRNRVGRLVDDLRAFYPEGTLCNDSLNACLGDSSLRRRLSDVFSGRRKWHSGVGLLLCGYLLRSTPVNVQLSLPFEGVPREPLNEPAVLSSIRQGASLRSIAAMHDVSVTTLSVLAKARGWPVRFRPKTVSENLRKEVIRALQCAEAPSAIARRLRLSISTVYRVRRAAGSEISSMLATQLEAEKHARRTQWVGWCKTGRHTSRSLRELHPGPWMWLYRHDVDWLRAHTPVRTFHKHTERHPVNWEARQAVLFPVLTRAIQLIQNHERHPRVTLTLICREAGVGELSRKELAKMPRLRALLKESVESKQLYVLRRLAEAASKMRSRGKLLTRSGVVREARIRPTTVSKAYVNVELFLSHGALK